MVNGYMAKTLEEALKIRKEKDVVPYAGGTDLMIKARKDVEYLFINKLKELKEIKVDDEYIRIGAGCSFTQVIESEYTPQIMADALKEIAAPAIRNFGTMGGNIANGSAKADSVLIEYALDAKLVIRSLDGERIIDITDFYKDNKVLDLSKDELITEILIPKENLDNYYYKKVGPRKALAISRVSIAGLIHIEDGVIEKFTLALGAIEDKVVRRKNIESLLVGKTLEQARAIKDQVIDCYEKSINPIQGRVSTEYRKTVSMNLVRDYLEEKGI